MSTIILPSPSSCKWSNRFVLWYLRHCNHGEAKGAEVLQWNLNSMSVSFWWVTISFLSRMQQARLRLLVITWRLGVITLAADLLEGFYEWSWIAWGFYDCNWLNIRVSVVSVSFSSLWALRWQTECCYFLMYSDRMKSWPIFLGISQRKSVMTCQSQCICRNEMILGRSDWCTSYLSWKNSSVSMTNVE